MKREREMAPHLHYSSLASDEMYYSMTYSLLHRGSAECFALSLEEGVEFRTPIDDGRVIELVAPRPQWERRSLGEGKRLLREAARGFVPDSVLARRRRRTGTLLGYFDRETRQVHRKLFEDAFAEPVLAQLGIVDRAELQRAWNRYLNEGGGGLGLRLYNTMRAEYWMRLKTGNGYSRFASKQ